MTRSYARETFLARMEALAAASLSSDLQSHGIVATERDPARLLRNGLAVGGFAAFEDFFIKRSTELLSVIDPLRIPFTSLPAKLQVAATWGAIQTLVSRARIDKDPASRMALIQNHAAHLASTANSNYQLSGLSFAPQGSNLSSTDVEDALKALTVDGPWVQLTSIASRVGYGLLGLGEILQSSAANRHEAAHLAEADLTITDIQALPTNLRVVGLCVDALMWRAVSDLPDALSKGAKLTGLADAIGIRFIDEIGGRFKEYKEGSTRARRWTDDVDTAIREAVPHATSAGEIVVVRDAQGLPVQWHIP